MADPFEKLSKPADPFAKLSAPKQAAPAQDPFAKLSQGKPEDIEQKVEEHKWYDRPLLIPGEVTDDEIKQYASKYKVDPAKLKEFVPLMSGLPQGAQAKDILKLGAGVVGEAAGLGIPQKIMKMSQDPQTEKALDALQDLISTKKSYAQYGAEFAVPGLGTAKLFKAAGAGIKGAAAAGAVVGAAGGFGYSKAGQELSGTAIGAGLGAPLGAAAKAAEPYIAKGAEKLGNIAKKTWDTLTNPEKNKILTADLDELNKIADQQLTTPAQKTVQELAFGRKAIDNMSSEEIDSVLKQTHDAEELQTIINADTARRQELLKRGIDTGVITPRDVNDLGAQRASMRVLLDDSVKAIRQDFLENLTGRKVPLDNLEEAWTSALRQGPEQIGTEFSRFRKGQLVDDLIEQRGIQDFAPESKIGQVASKASDARFSLRRIDEKFKSATERELDELSRGRNLMSHMTHDAGVKLDNLFKQAETTGAIEAARSGKIVDAIENASIDKLPPAEAQIAQGVTDIFNEAYDFVNEGIKAKGFAPFAIPKAEQYVHKVSIPAAEVAAKIESRLRDAASEASQLLGREVRDVSLLSPSEQASVMQLSSLQDVRQFLNYALGTDFQGGASDLAAAARKLIRSEEGKQTLDRMAKGTLERTGGKMPDFIREKNVFKIIDRYTNSMYSSLYQRDALSKLRYSADRIDKMGGKSEAQYIRNIIEDTLSVRKGTMASFMRDAKGQLARILDPKIEDAVRRGDKTDALIWNTMKYSAELPAYLARQIYPNVLGWRFAPIMDNMISGIARTAPELGTKYGYTTYLRGLAYGLLNWKNMEREIVQLGLVPREFSRAGHVAITEGIRASKLVNAPLEVIDMLGKLGMHIYEKSEHMNRISILGTAKMMAHDLVKSKALAAEALLKFPGSVRRAVASAGKDENLITQIIATHLNGSTAFNYNRPSLYEFGRTMGPMFATFAKWPTSIAGEMMSDIRVKGIPAGLGRMAERYALPLIGLSLADYMLQDALGDSDRMQKVFSKQGIAKAAPIKAATGFFSGDIFTPPMVDTVMQGIVVPTIKGEGGQLIKGLDRAASAYVPGAGLIKFLTDDLPTYITGRRPEGSTQLERSIEGAKTLIK